MRRIYAGLCVWNLVVWLGAGTLALLPAGVVPPRTHAAVGLFAAFFACLVPSVLIAHFIGTMKWMEQAGRTAGLDTRTTRRAWVKGPVFPVLVVCALLAVFTAVSGRAAATSAGGRWLHVALALAQLPASVIALRLSLRGLDANTARMRAVAVSADAARATGAAPPDEPEALLPESTRAGGKVLLWLAPQAWLAFAYFRWVLRDADHPVWPYAAASVLLAVLGVAMLRSEPPTDRPAR